MPETTVDVPTPDGVADSYLFRPDGAGPHPGVLLFMDAFGLRPQLEAMAARIAERGYVVLVPNLFHRSGRTPLLDATDLSDAGKRGAAFEIAMPMIKALDAETIARDAGAYLDFLDAQDGVAAGPDAAVGYCMGGRNALLAAAAHPGRLAAVASFHAGGMVTDQPDSPHLRLAAITGEVYLGHADKDRSMPPEHIAAVESALAGVTHTSEVYDGAPHGFTMADTSMHDEAAERRHWAALFDLLDRVVPSTR